MLFAGNLFCSNRLPVITSNFTNLQNIVHNSSCGVTVDPTDPKKIASEIHRLISNPDLARELGRNGMRAVQERYNWKEAEKNLLRLYTQVLTC